MSEISNRMTSLEKSIFVSNHKKQVSTISEMVKNEEDGDSEILSFSDSAKPALYEHDVIDVIRELSRGKEESIKYLEIGVNEGDTFNKVKAHTKHGVDPYGGCENITHNMTSQEFFVYNKYFWKNTYDIIFIDGMHMADIIIQEVRESLKILNPGGVILLHDVAPLRESAQEVWYGDYIKFMENRSNLGKKEKSFQEYCKEHPWIGINGDAWKVMAHLRINTDLSMVSVATACCGIICPHITLKSVYEPPELPVDGIYSWDYYKENSYNILNPINLDEVWRLSKTICWEKK